MNDKEKSMKFLKVLLVLLVLLIIVFIEYIIWGKLENYNKIIAIIAGVVVFSMLSTCIILWKHNTQPKYDKLLTKNKSDMTEEDYQRICNARELWKVTATLCNFAHIVLTCTSLFCSIIVVYIASTNFNDAEASVIFFSIAAITLTTLDWVLSPAAKATDNRKAFTLINYSLFQYDNGLISAKELIDAVDQCEQYISNSLV